MESDFILAESPEMARPKKSFVFCHSRMFPAKITRENKL